MSTHITPLEPRSGSPKPPSGADIFASYRRRRGAQTLRQHDAGLRLFASYRAQHGFTGGPLNEGPVPWRGVTWGLIMDFVAWLLNQGYAISTVNARLSVVKTYVTLAFQAGVIPPAEWALIQTIAGYRGNEAQRVDENRRAAQQPTRVGCKKAEPVRLTQEQAIALKQTPGDSPQSHRDRMMMCLLLDHGLRCSELAGVQTASVDLARAQVRFYRPKVNRTQTLK